ncbi:MAG TPA: hypothetical protein VGC21_09480 [Telluria sp.]|jgi:hypothetical protein
MMHSTTDDVTRVDTRLALSVSEAIRLQKTSGAVLAWAWLIKADCPTPTIMRVLGGGPQRHSGAEQ